MDVQIQILYTSNLSGRIREQNASKNNDRKLLGPYNMTNIQGDHKVFPWLQIFIAKKTN
jgi:hypothetical protein